MTQGAAEQASSVEICELFESISGESTLAGTPAVFVRLAGCNLRCRWCDTRYALDPGTRLPVSRVVEAICQSPIGLVVVTGGEPLQQPGTVHLCAALLARQRRVQVETNGSLDVSVLPEQVQIVLDVKPPSSGELERMDVHNPGRLRAGDNLKIVLADRADFDWAVELLTSTHLPPGVEVLLSPAAGHLEPQALARWLLDSALPVRMQIQLHRLLWPEGPEGRPLSIGRNS